MDPMTYDPERSREVAQRAEDAGLACCLHLQAAVLMPDGQYQVRFGIGEGAFSDRVLHPEIERDEAALRAAEVEMGRAEPGELRRRRAEGPLGRLAERED